MFSQMLQESFKVSISDVCSLNIREAGRKRDRKRRDKKRDIHKRAVFAMLLDVCHRQQEKGHAQTGKYGAQVQ